MDSAESVSKTEVSRRLVSVRGRRAILDETLAELYGVTTRRLNEQVRRNRRRFPGDFLFELTPEESTILMSQNATSSWGGRRKPPLVFTEHGAIMAAAVLNSPRAVVAPDLGTQRQFAEVFEAIQSLRADPVPKRRPIGFTREENGDS